MVHKFFTFVLLVVSLFYSASNTPFLSEAHADVIVDGGHDTDGAPSSASADCAGGSSDCAGSAGACE